MSASAAGQDKEEQREQPAAASAGAAGEESEYLCLTDMVATTGKFAAHSGRSSCRGRW